MKNFVMILAALLIISCGVKKAPISNNANVNVSPSKTITKSNNYNFDWLLGTWQRANDKEGKRTYEFWHKVGDKHYEGIGYTLQGQDTISQEKMLLMELHDVWGFNVVAGADPMVRFKLIDVTESSFVCENQDNDFPKVIKYWKDQYRLKAEISGGGPTIPFVFAKVVK